MINGRPVHPLVKLAIVVVIGYLVLGQLVHYALLPVVIGLIAWGGYRIFTSERGGRPRQYDRRSGTTKTVKRARPDLRMVRFDPSEDLTVPKDWK